MLLSLVVSDPQQHSRVPAGQLCRAPSGLPEQELPGQGQLHPPQQLRGQQLAAARLQHLQLLSSLWQFTGRQHLEDWV